MLDSSLVLTQCRFASECSKANCTEGLYCTEGLSGNCTERLYCTERLSGNGTVDNLLLRDSGKMVGEALLALISCESRWVRGRSWESRLLKSSGLRIVVESSGSISSAPSLHWPAGLGSSLHWPPGLGSSLHWPPLATTYTEGSASRHCSVELRFRELQCAQWQFRRTLIAEVYTCSSEVYTTLIAEVFTE